MYLRKLTLLPVAFVVVFFAVSINLLGCGDCEVKQFGKACKYEVSDECCDNLQSTAGYGAPDCDSSDLDKIAKCRDASCCDDD
mmetsp:Transcript_157439/g.277737  ORF Transcript_157439/g.277737 Transcript_157439/m.277737 type:complete len:83 (-) Transcript_157439:57-305(-)